MPVLPSSPSDFTATLKSAAIANAAVGGVSFRPSKNSGGFVSLGALGAIVTQSAVARATISQRFDPDLAPAAPAPEPIIQSITLNRTGTTEVYIVKYNTNGSIQWARRINGQGAGWTGTATGPGQGITTDSSGNVYVTGTSEGAVTVFDIDNVSTAFSLGSEGNGDIFIVKYSPAGTPLWARRIAGGQIDQSNGIGTDSAGNVYVGGIFFTSVALFGATDTSSSLSVTSISSADAFIAKYNSSGTPQWIRKIASAGNDQGMAMAVDTSGNVFVSGYTTASSISLYNGSDVASVTLTGGSGSQRGYIAKYDTTGDPKWLRVFSNGGNTVSTAITTDSSGNSYVAGQFDNIGSLTTLGGTNTLTLTVLQSGEDTAYLIKYDTSGEPVWARVLIPGRLVRFGIATDSSANVYLGGFYGPINIRNADGSSFVTDTAVGTGVAIVKYASDGTPQWFRKIDGSGSDSGANLSTDSTGNLYVTGQYASSPLTVFNGSVDGKTTGTTAFTTLANSGTEDTFLVKYNTSGTPLWATRIGGTGSDIPSAVKSDASGNVVAVGKYTSNPLTLRTTGF